jgi:hypothetical protein
MFDKIKWDASIAPSLDALLRRASWVAEEMFDELDPLPMVWLIDSPDKGQAMLVTPISTAQQKRTLAQSLREFFNNNGVSRYAFAAESWLRDLDGEAIGEIIALRSEDDREAYGATREIVRPPQGKRCLAWISMERN